MASITQTPQGPYSIKEYVKVYDAHGHLLADCGDESNIVSPEQCASARLFSVSYDMFKLLEKLQEKLFEFCNPIMLENLSYEIDEMGDLLDKVKL